MLLNDGENILVLSIISEYYLNETAGNFYLYFLFQ
jgi:hypothetical protein